MKLNGLLRSFRHRSDHMNPDERHIVGSLSIGHYDQVVLANQHGHEAIQLGILPHVASEGPQITVFLGFAYFGSNSASSWL